MARPTIENIKSLGDFQTNLNWNIAIATPPTNLSSSLTTDDFNFRCRSTEVPMYDSQPVQIAIRGHVVRQPGTYIPTGTFAFQLVETTDNKVKRMLKDWRELCWAPRTGVQQTKADVQATLYLELLNRQDQVIWQYFLYGCFLESFDVMGGAQLADGMQQDIVAPSVRLSYDYFIDTPVDGLSDPSDETSSNTTTPTFGSGSGGVGGFAR